MSIASDLRSYADHAVNQGKQVTELTRENLAEIAGKATSAVNELRISAERAFNVDALKTAVEPYLAQVKDHTHTVTDKAEALYAQVKSDKRVGRFVESAETVTVVVVDTVQEHVVKPVQTLAGRGAGPAPQTRKPAATTPAAAKPATTTPATAKPATAKPATAKPATAKSASAKPAARKAPAKRTAS